MIVKAIAVVAVVVVVVVVIAMMRKNGQREMGKAEEPWRLSELVERWNYPTSMERSCMI